MDTEVKLRAAIEKDILDKDKKGLDEEKVLGAGKAHTLERETDKDGKSGEVGTATLKDFTHVYEVPSKINEGKYEGYDMKKVEAFNNDLYIQEWI